MGRRGRRGVWIVWTSSDGLMIHPGWLSRTLGLRPGIPVIVRIRQQAGDACKLGLEHSARMTRAVVIAKADGIECGDRLNRTGDILPQSGRWRRAIVEAHAEFVEIRREEGHSTFVHG